MADDPSVRGAADRQRINIEQENEVRYWTEKLHITQEQLHEAVKEVGPMAYAVENHVRERSAQGHWRDKSVG